MPLRHINRHVRKITSRASGTGGRAVAYPVAFLASAGSVTLILGMNVYLQEVYGATGVFIAGTGESPGTNRLEVAADAGKVVCENESLTFTRNETPASTFNKTSKQAFSRPDFWNIEIPVSGVGGQHAADRAR